MCKGASTPPLPEEGSPDSSKRLIEAGPRVRGCAVGDRVTLATEVSCGHCDWCTRRLHKFCEDGGPIGVAAGQGGVSLFARLPSGGPLVACTTNAIHYQATAVFGAFAASLRIARRPGVPWPLAACALQR